MRLDPLTNQKLEVLQEDMHDPGWPSDLLADPMQLLVVNLVQDEPIQHYRGEMTPKEDVRDRRDEVEVSRTHQPQRLDEILRYGIFMIEVPQQSFHSQLIAAKLLKAAPEQRLNLLYQLMREKQIARVMVIFPTDA